METTATMETAATMETTAVVVTAERSGQDEVQADSSRFKVNTIHYTWNISDFKDMMNPSIKSIKSVEFGESSPNGSRWLLELVRTPSGSVSLYLHLVDCAQDALNVKCKWTLVVNGEEIYFKSFLSKAMDIKPTSAIVWLDFIRLKRGYFHVSSKRFSNQAKLKSLSQLKIVCHIWTEAAGAMSADEGFVNVKIPQRRLSRDFESLLAKPATGDVTLCLGSQEIKCHKAILMARSPVFAAMFEHDMEEKEQGKVEIEGIEYEVLEEIIYFMYTGRIKNIAKNTIQLLEAADRYLLERLKALCEKQLCLDALEGNFTFVGAAVDVLVCADRHSCHELKQRIKEFISFHLEEILQTESWKMLATTDINLLNEVVQLCTENNNPSSGRCWRIQLSE